MISSEIRNRFEAACKNVEFLEGIRVRRLCSAYEWFIGAKLADKHFDQSLLSDNGYYNRLSEILVAYKLMRAGYRLRSADKGPDFWAQKDGLGFWVEVVTPQPRNIDANYLSQIGGEPEEQFIVPMDQILRRWTHAIDSKAQALLGPRDETSSTRNKAGYLKKGIVKPNESYVIAVNACHLRGNLGIGFNGISGKPCAVEALFAIGPMSFAFHSAPNGGLRSSGFRHTQRTELPSLNDAPIPLTTFLHDKYASISAVWALDIDEEEVLLDPMWPGVERNYFASAGVFNPLATNPLDVGMLPTFEDWTCEISGDSYGLIHHNRIPPPVIR